MSALTCSVARSLAASVAGLVVAVTLPQLAVPAAAYPVSSGTLAVSSTTALVPGHTVGLTGGGYTPGTSVSIDVFSAVIHLATVSASGAGAITTTVKIPAGLAPGRHLLEATGAAAAGGTRVLSIAFTVPGGLPTTGTPTLTISAAGLAAVTAGSMLLVLVRRRRQVVGRHRLAVGAEGLGRA